MLPTALYIHMPWCIRKCPYCDFNSHKSPEKLPEEQYINALLEDFTTDLTYLPKRTISTIFIGGGTPSLFSAQAYERLLQQLNQVVDFSPTIEITLEANPGSVEQQRFYDYRRLGINRISLGIQSFNPRHLTALGRIHDDHQAHRAIDAARTAGFDNINIDIMHSLPNQTLAQGLKDLKIAIAHQPQHISWYQLTIEPNTLFHKMPPPQPSDDDTDTLEQQGFALLATHGFKRYEISAFSRLGFESLHNLNYWQFGDYYGIGAGAHGKITLSDISKNEPVVRICRTRKQRQPHYYLSADKPFLAAQDFIDEQAVIFEFMLNTTRLQTPIPHTLWMMRTGLSWSKLYPLLIQAQQKKLLEINATHWQVSALGRRFTNDLQEIFLPG